MTVARGCRGVFSNSQLDAGVQEYFKLTVACGLRSIFILTVAQCTELRGMKGIRGIRGTRGLRRLRELRGMEANFRKFWKSLSVFRNLYKNRNFRIFRTFRNFLKI